MRSDPRLKIILALIIIYGILYSPSRNTQQSYPPLPCTNVTSNALQCYDCCQQTQNPEQCIDNPCQLVRQHYFSTETYQIRYVDTINIEQCYTQTHQSYVNLTKNYNHEYYELARSFRYANLDLIRYMLTTRNIYCKDPRFSDFPEVNTMGMLYCLKDNSTCISLNNGICIIKKFIW